MQLKKIKLKQAVAEIKQPWTPHIVGEVSGTQLKLGKLAGEFVWHSHAEEDEAFLVLKGSLRIELRDGVVELSEGELVVIPRGVEHRPVAEEECHVLLIEPAGTLNTGAADDPRRLTDLPVI